VLESNDIGGIQHVHIRHDNGGSSPGWFVESVTVQDLQTYAEYQFACSQWLATDQGDGAIERELQEASE
jgi:lipoxygenase homology domain-containing protein 1